MSRLRLLSVGLLLLPLAARAAGLQTSDGLKLELSATGRVTGLADGKTTLPLKGPGGFAVADFADQPPLPNLVPNGGFETGATGWSLGPGQSVDTTLAHSGQACVKLHVPGPEPAQSNLGLLLPVKPSTRYHAGLWVRRENVGVCGAYISERDAEGKLSGAQTQVGAAIPKQDGVWLPLQWEFVTGPRTVSVSLRADIYRSTGTLWLDDFYLREPVEGVYEPVSGAVKTTPAGLQFTGGLPARGLTVTAAFRSRGDALQVDGVVQDTTGRDRAVGLRFALPVDLTGWDWYTDAEEKEPLTARSDPYRYTYDCQSGLGKCSIYPWSAASGKTTGLSLALPLSQGPRVFLLQYEPRTPEYSLTFFFGLAKDAGNNPSRAPFSFVLYRHDPRWGMRAAMATYYRLFPESFVKRPAFEAYLNYGDYERLDPKTHDLVVPAAGRVPDGSDFGEGFNFIAHVHGCYDFRQVPYADPTRPSDDTVRGLLQAMVAQEQTKPAAYVPTAETLRKICYGAQGQILYIGDTQYWRPHEGYNHTDQAGWGLNFRVNEDPGVSPHLQERSRRQAEAYAKSPAYRPWNGTFTADAIEGYMSNTYGLDYRREHFATTLPPLTFGKDNLQPALVNTIWDFLHKAWWPLTQETKIVTYGNANCYEQVFTMPYVDIPMTEGNWDPRHDGRLDRYMRAVNYHKIWRYWHAWDKAGGYGDQQPDFVVGQLVRGLAYGIYPSVYSVQGMGRDLESYRHLYRQYLPATEELSAAGWEPVPHARLQGTGGAPPADVVVERFGSFAGGELHFTLRNYGDEAVLATLALDRAGLGVPGPAELVVQDILPRSPQFDPIASGGPQVSVEPRGATALWVGTRDQAARHGLRLATRTLERLERLFATEMTASAKTAWEKAVKLAREGETAKPARLLTLAEELQSALDALPAALATQAPADLAKLVFRAKVETSYVPAALLKLQLGGPFPVGEAARGETQQLRCRLTDLPPATTGLAGQVLSPWPALATGTQVAVETTVGAATATVSIPTPAAPPRSSLAYLVEFRAVAGGSPFRLCLPYDHVVGETLALTAEPERLFRGQERRVRLTCANRLRTGGEVTVTLGPVKLVGIQPAQFALTLPAQGQATGDVTLTLDRNVPIGDLRLPYKVEGPDARFSSTGTVLFSVGDPVPQVRLPRLPAAPVIDGKLEDAAWKQAPLVPELRKLVGGGEATEKTSVWAACNDQGVYVAFNCLESQMGKVVAKYSERGSPLYLDDDVEVFLVPPHAAQVYQFAVNANGAQSDNSGNKSAWQAAAWRGPDRWTVELFIPFSAVGVAASPAGGLPWGVQFGRQQKAKGETTSWTPGTAFIVKETMAEVTID